MTPPPSAWCDRNVLAKWLFSRYAVSNPDGRPATAWEDESALSKILWFMDADALLSSGCIEKKPTYEEMLCEAGLGATSSTEDIAYMWEAMIDAASPQEE